MSDFFLDHTVQFCLLFLGSGILWWKSGRSPMVWIAVWSLHIEAIRLQVIASFVVALRHFSDNYTDTATLVRSQQLEQETEWQK